LIKYWLFGMIVALILCEEISKVEKKICIHIFVIICLTCFVKNNKRRGKLTMRSIQSSKPKKPRKTAKQEDFSLSVIFV